jgi:S-adenosylmethionine synthetase
MTRNIKVEELLKTPIEKQRIELLERKGIGHPDSISDGLAEAVSHALCRNTSTNVGLYSTTTPMKLRL